MRVSVEARNVHTGTENFRGVRVRALPAAGNDMFSLTGGSGRGEDSEGAHPRGGALDWGAEFLFRFGRRWLASCMASVLACARG